MTKFRSIQIFPFLSRTPTDHQLRLLQLFCCSCKLNTKCDDGFLLRCGVNDSERRTDIHDILHVGFDLDREEDTLKRMGEEGDEESIFMFLMVTVAILLA